MAEILEREELLEELERARADGGRLVFVGGEAGVGKTSLARAFTTRVEGRHGESAILQHGSGFADLRCLTGRVR